MDNIKEVIEKNYNLDVIEIEKFKNAYRVKTTDGYKCFKISKYDENQFNFIMNAIKHLELNGCKNILPACPKIDGSYFLKLDKSYGYVCKWIDSREANYSNPVELKMCIDALCNLHVASIGFNPENVPKCRNYYGKWIEKFEKRCGEMLYFKASIMSKDKKTEFDDTYLLHFTSHYKQALKAVSDLKASKYYEIIENHKSLNELCHHDTANHNFLITSDLDVYIIDFDYCILDSHLHDLASLIIRNMRHGNWNFDILNYILEVYSNKIKITDDDIYMIFCFMQFPQDFWQIGLQYYVEKQPWSEDYFMKKLTRVTDDWKMRFNFINEFETSFKED